jgi:hypothetical protein
MEKIPISFHHKGKNYVGYLNPLPGWAVFYLQKCKPEFMRPDYPNKLFRDKRASLVLLLLSLMKDPFKEAALAY